MKEKLLIFLAWANYQDNPLEGSYDEICLKLFYLSVALKEICYDFTNQKNIWRERKLNFSGNDSSQKVELQMFSNLCLFVFPFHLIASYPPIVFSNISIVLCIVCHYCISNQILRRFECFSIWAQTFRNSITTGTSIAGNKLKCVTPTYCKTWDLE